MQDIAKIGRSFVVEKNCIACSCHSTSSAASVRCPEYEECECVGESLLGLATRLWAWGWGKKSLMQKNKCVTAKPTHSHGTDRMPARTPSRPPLHVKHRAFLETRAYSQLRPSIALVEAFTVLGRASTLQCFLELGNHRAGIGRVAGHDR